MTIIWHFAVNIRLFFYHFLSPRTRGTHYWRVRPLFLGNVRHPLSRAYVESSAGAEEPVKYYYFYIKRIIIATISDYNIIFRRNPDIHGGFRGRFSDIFKYQLTLSILYTLKL
jgi:hypothetical protein